jgi:hypothetical protein
MEFNSNAEYLKAFPPSLNRRVIEQNSTTPPEIITQVPHHSTDIIFHEANFNTIKFSNCLNEISNLSTQRILLYAHMF